jgi:hypothetical protein
MEGHNNKQIIALGDITDEGEGDESVMDQSALTKFVFKNNDESPGIVEQINDVPTFPNNVIESENFGNDRLLSINVTMGNPGAAAFIDEELTA